MKERFRLLNIGNERQKTTKKKKQQQQKKKKKTERKNRKWHTTEPNICLMLIYIQFIFI